MDLHHLVLLAPVVVAVAAVVRTTVVLPADKVEAILHHMAAVAAVVGPVLQPVVEEDKVDKVFLLFNILRPQEEEL
jgi:hypothetical protein